MTLRIVLADDHPLFVVGVEAALRRQRLGRVVATAGCGDVLIDSLRSAACDLVITDFSMPAGRHGDGLRLLGYLARHFPCVPVVVLTSHVNPGVLASIAQQRVAGVISKAGMHGELSKAVRAAAGGRVYMSESVRLLIGLDNLARLRSLGKLSPRETEILRLLASGMSGDQIAHHIQRSKKTVSRQKRAGMRKLGVATDAEFFLYLRERDDLLARHEPVQTS